ncbi:MAG: FHA domain-containing protein [Pirellulales bacterium]|nr:FHA domain-containing protein [Pirellulales bacterium]
MEILRGRARNRWRPIQAPAFLIGTAADCDLVLGDERYAEVHACILVREDGVWMRHLGFEPEITVNGTPSGRIQLNDGDIIRTGPYEFRILIRYQDRKPAEDPSHSILNGPHRLRIHPATVNAEILAQVQGLLHDIRSAIQLDESAIRLYVKPNDGICPSRYPVLAAGQMLASWRAKGA